MALFADVWSTFGCILSVFYRRCAVLIWYWYKNPMDLFVAMPNKNSERRLQTVSGQICAGFPAPVSFACAQCLRWWWRVAFRIARALVLFRLAGYMLVYFLIKDIICNFSLSTAHEVGWKWGWRQAVMACYKLGYTFATMRITELRRLNSVSNKCSPSTNRFLQFETREDGIASNRKSAKLRWTGSEVLYKPPVTVWK